MKLMSSVFKISFVHWTRKNADAESNRNCFIRTTDGILEKAPIVGLHNWQRSKLREVMKLRSSILKISCSVFVSPCVTVVKFVKYAYPLLYAVVHWTWKMWMEKATMMLHQHRRWNSGKSQTIGCTTSRIAPTGSICYSIYELVIA